MATPVLVSEIIEQARVRLDDDTYTSSTHITSAIALSWVKYSARRLSAFIRRAYGSDYFVTRGTLTTQASVDFVSLPENCTDVRSLSWMRSSTQGVPLEQMSVDEWVASGENVRSWDGAPKYRVLGNTIAFNPCPNAAYSLSIWYDTGIFVTATTDTIQIQPSWEEWLVLDFCCRSRMRDEKPYQEFAVERAQIEDEIKRQASDRDRFRTHQVRDLWDGGDWIDSRSLFARR